MDRETLGFTEEQAAAIVEIIKSSCIPTLGGCLERQKTPNKDGYTVIRHRDKVYPAHRMMYMLCKGLKEKSSVVMHKCDNRRCVNIEHLQEGTHARNLYDCIVKHRTDWQIKGPVELKPKVSDESREHSLKAAFEAIKVKLSGNTLAETAVITGIAESTIKRWLMAVFGTCNAVGSKVFDPVSQEEVFIVKRGDKIKRDNPKARMRQAAAEARKAEKEALKNKMAEMYQTGMDIYKISAATGKSTSCVRDAIIDRLGIVPVTKIGKPDKSEMARDLSLGMSYKAVSEKYGVSEATVRIAEKMFRVS